MWPIGGAVALLAGMVAAPSSCCSAAEGPEVSSPIAIGTPPLRLDAGPKAVWVTSEKDGTLTRLDPETGEIVGKPRRIGEGVSGVAVGGDDLGDDPGAERCCASTSAAAGSCAESILGGTRATRPRRPAGLARRPRRQRRQCRQRRGGQPLPQRPAATGSGAARSPGAGAGSGSRSPTAGVLRASTPSASSPAADPRRPRTGRGHRCRRLRLGRQQSLGHGPPRSTPAACGRRLDRVGGQPGGIDAGTSAVWVADRSDDAVRKIDLESGEVEGASIQVGPEPGAVAVGGDAVWVANNGDGTVTRIEP